ncbi:hypothetical protein ACFZAM_05015 [Streptomyces sp. NPDC008079]
MTDADLRTEGRPEGRTEGRPEGRTPRDWAVDAAALCFAVLVGMVV